MNHIYTQSQFGEEWFTYPTLYSDMVKKFPSGSKFVEIGSWKGKSSAYMAVEIANSTKNIEFTCVDTFLGSVCHQGMEGLSELYDVFKNNMKPVEPYYRDLKMTSLEAVKLFEDNSLDFVFIDACHEYDNVKADIMAWLPKVKPGGILAGHDYVETWSGVIRAVNELLPPTFYTKEYCWVYEIPSV